MELSLAKKYRSLLSTEQGDTLEFPIPFGEDSTWGCSIFLLVVRGRVGAEEHSRDQVLIITLGVLVDRALVEVLGLRLLFATAWGGTGISLGRCRHGCEMNDGEGLEGILRGLVLEFLLVSGPGGTFDVETVDAHTFRWYVESLLDATIFTSNDFFLDFSLRLDGIKRPFLL